MSGSDSAQNNDASESTVIWAGKHNDALDAREKQISEANAAQLTKLAPVHPIGNKPSLPLIDLIHSKPQSDHSPGNGHDTGREHAAKPKPKPKTNDLDSLSDKDQKLVNAINKYRKDHGLRELIVNRTLTQGAKANNNAMVAQHRFGHIAPLNNTAEVVAMQPGSAEDVLNAWLGSHQGHRELVTGANMRYIGVARNGNLATARLSAWRV